MRNRVWFFDGFNRPGFKNKLINMSQNSRLQVDLDITQTKVEELKKQLTEKDRIIAQLRASIEELTG